MLLKELTNLNEGLIKVPKDMIGQLVKRVYTDYLSYMFTQTELKDEAQTLARKFSVEINKAFKAKNYFTEIESTLDGLSDKVKSVWRYEFGRLDFAIDWENRYYVDAPTSNATFDEKTGQFLINPKKFIELVSSPDVSIKKIEALLEKVKVSMWHEASHAIQHNALKWLDKNQVGKSRAARDNPESSKEERRKEYLSSAVEFDPQLKTKIFLFRDRYAKLSNTREILKMMAVFVGAVQIDGEKNDDFFMALKATDLKKWKKAVKLFYQYFDIDVNKLIEY